MSDLSLFTIVLRFQCSGSMSLGDSSDLPDEVQSRNYLIVRLLLHIVEKYTLTGICRDCLAKDMLVYKHIHYTCNNTVVCGKHTEVSRDKDAISVAC